MRLAKPWERHLARLRTDKRARQCRAFIRREAAIGGQLFGPVPESHRREFVCLNKRTWVWHEEWPDERGAWQMSTTCYDVRPDGVYKLQEGGTYRPVGKQETQHLRDAATLYHQQVQLILYNKKRRKLFSRAKTL